jgi:hypothetical protein
MNKHILFLLSLVFLHYGILTADCPGNLVLNGGFTAGLVVGPMPSPGQVSNWSRVYGSPDVAIGAGCEDTGNVSMWGNRMIGEAIQQILPGSGFVSGKTYRVTMCVRSNYVPGRINYVQFKLRASNVQLTSPTDVNGVTIGITDTISSTSFVTVTLPDWTAGGNYTHLTISPEDYSSEINGDSTSYGAVDNICVQEITQSGDTVVTFNGLLHQSIGTSRLVLLGDTSIVIKNFSDGDGVRIYLPDTVNQFDVVLDTTMAGLLPDSSIISRKDYAHVNGVANTLISSVYFNKQEDGSWDYVVDNSPLGVISESLYVFNNATLVYHESIPQSSKSYSSIHGITSMGIGKLNLFQKIKVNVFTKISHVKITGPVDICGADGSEIHVGVGGKYKMDDVEVLGALNQRTAKVLKKGSMDAPTMIIVPTGSNDTLVATSCYVITHWGNDFLFTGPGSTELTFSGIHDVTIKGEISNKTAQFAHAEFPLSDGWNLMSLPVIQPDAQMAAVFPTAISKAFCYENGYQTEDTLEEGVGYWVKLPGAKQISMIGFPYDSLRIAVQAGWNMVGSLTTPIPVSSIISEPPGLITSNFFGYNNSYFVSSTLTPGQGYWVRVLSAGTLILNATSAEKLSRNAIRIIPTSELPPPPPDGSNAMEPAIPKEYGLEQAYPNPFNPSTTIQYQLPSDSKVNLHIFNILGQIVQTLVNQTEQAGYKQVEWNASNFASGLYFYRLEATSVANPSKTFTSVKKMLLMK